MIRGDRIVAYDGIVHVVAKTEVDYGKLLCTCVCAPGFWWNPDEYPAVAKPATCFWCVAGRVR